MQSLNSGGVLAYLSIDLISRTAPTGSRFSQHAECKQFVDVAQRGVRGALGERSPLAAGKVDRAKMKQLSAEPRANVRAFAVMLDHQEKRP